MIDGFAVGPLFIRFYGIILMLGAVAGGWVASREVKRRGYDPEMVWDLLVYLIIGGVIGARLWHIFTPPPSSIAQGFTTQYYLTHPLDALAIWKGGLGIPGTIIGGLIAFVRDGDLIEIDIPNRRLELLVPEEELARRRVGWQPRAPAIHTGFLELYSRIVTQADQGAILKA